MSAGTIKLAKAATGASADGAGRVNEPGALQASKRQRRVATMMAPAMRAVRSNMQFDIGEDEKKIILAFRRMSLESQRHILQICPVLVGIDIKHGLVDAGPKFTLIQGGTA